MKPIAGTSRRAVGFERPEIVRGAPAQSVAITAAALHLQETLAHIETLQQELEASRREVVTLATANARLTELNDAARSDTHWSPCHPSSLSSPGGFESHLRALIDALRPLQIRLHNDDVLFRVGDPFKAIFAIRAGSCKVVLLTSGGQEQIAAFHMAGEIIGTDGIGARFHGSQAIALEDMEVYRLQFDQVERLARFSGEFGHTLHGLLSQETTRAHLMMLALGTLRADQRLAMFLLDLSDRYRARGYSPSEFVLRLTRAEIGSYLGLKLETVSRIFSRFQREGAIQIEGRCVKLLDRPALKQILS